MRIYKSTGIEKFDFALSSLDNHLHISGKSISTRKSYANGLHKFLIHSNKLPEECTKEEIINYFITFKNNRGLQLASLKIYIYSIKYYLKNIAERIDLFDKIPIPVTKQYKLNVLNIHEISLLFDSCKNCRERLIIHLLYETGIRVSELVKLNINDFDFHNKTLIVRDSKNRKTRTLYFGDKLVKSLKEYHQSNKSLFSDSLFTRQFHPFIPLSKKGVSWVLKALAKRSGVHKRVNAHSFRHAFAVHYLNFGGTIYQLQKLLGHSYLTTTCYYLQYAILPESKNISILDKLTETKQDNIFNFLRA